MSDGDNTILLFPAGTHFYAPDEINRVIIMFGTQDAAILFFEWCREQVIRAEQAAE